MYRILIVEDDSTIASNVAAHLERWDYETKQIEDFKCVMEEFQQFDPQLVILDIGLPFYNGFLLVSGNPENIECSNSVFILYE